MRVRSVTQKDMETLMAILEMDAPSFRELGARFEIGPHATDDRLKRLECHGFLEPQRGRHRGIRITAEGYAALKRVGRDERTGKLYQRVEINQTGG